MKALALAVLLTVGSSASFFQEEDKQFHIGFSVFTGIAGNAFAHQQLGWTKQEAWWAGLATALLVGAVKEITDDKFDWRDMGADAIGGTIGTTGMYTIYKFQSGS